MNNEMNITKEEFQRYVDVQMSGVTNMFAITTVSNLSGLNKEQIQYIISNYSELEKQFEVL